MSDPGATSGSALAGRSVAWQPRDAAVLAVVVAICVLGLLLRLLGSGERTLFWDEAYHVELVLLPSVGEMLGAILANPPSDPLYALLLRGWTALTGTTGDAIVRLPSIVFGAATVAAAGWLGWELTHRRRIVIGAALLVAISPYLVQYGQEASLYSFATLTTTLALAAGWRWRDSARRRDGWLAVGLAVVAVYSHYVAPAVLGLAAVLAFSPIAGAARLSRRDALIGAVVVLLAWAAWLIPMLVSLVTIEQPRSMLPRSVQPSELLGALSQYTSGGGALITSNRPVQLLGLAAAAVLTLRGWHIAGTRDWPGLRVVLLTAAILFFGSWAAAALTGRWLFVAHLSLMTLPALAVVIAAAAMTWTLPRATGAPRRDMATAALVGAAGVGLLVAQVAGLWLKEAHPPHGGDGVGELAAVVRAEARPGEQVFVTPSELQIVVRRYWDGPLHGLPVDIDLHRLYRPSYDASAYQQQRIERFMALTAGHDRAWVVYRIELDSDGQFLAWLGERAELERKGTYPFADLYLVTLRR